MISHIAYNLTLRAEIIEAEKQKKDIRSIVLPSRASNSPNDGVKANNVPQSNVPEPTKR